MRAKEIFKAGMMGAVMALMATPAFARTIELKEAGPTLWIFVAIGAVIVLMQLIPALVLFFSFIGTTATMALKRKAAEVEGVTVPGLEPVAVKK